MGLGVARIDGDVHGHEAGLFEFADVFLSEELTVGEHHGHGPVVVHVGDEFVDVGAEHGLAAGEDDQAGAQVEGARDDGLEFFGGEFLTLGVDEGVGAAVDTSALAAEGDGEVSRGREDGAEHHLFEFALQGAKPRLARLGRVVEVVHVGAIHLGDDLERVEHAHEAVDEGLEHRAQLPGGLGDDAVAFHAGFDGKEIEHLSIARFSHCVSFFFGVRAAQDQW